MYLKKFLAASIAIVALSACGGEKAATNTDSKPANSSPATSTTSTSSPEATQASNSPKDTKSNDAKTLIKSTNPKASETSGASFQDVEAKDLTSFKHKSGLFSIDMPKAWGAPQDNSKPGEVINLWFDPTKNALVAVDIFNAPEGLTADKSTDLLQTFLKQTFGSRPNFAMEEPVKQPDGSVQIVWGYTETVKAGGKDATGWVQGNSFIEKQGDKVSLLTVGVLSKQFDDIKDSMTKVVNSYKVDPSVKIP